MWQNLFIYTHKNLTLILNIYLKMINNGKNTLKKLIFFIEFLVIKKDIKKSKLLTCFFINK